MVVKFEQFGDARNATQVLANGGIPTLFLMCYFSTHNLGFLIGSLSGFAAALSDTASSEIGTRYQQKTYIGKGIMVKKDFSQIRYL